MQLLCSDTSPYARKVRAVVIEKDLQDQVENHTNSPLDSNAMLLAANPLSKVPALQLPDGNTLYDSSVICEYLDSLAAQNPLFPTDHSRWQILRQQALANGLMDAAVAMIFEQKRPDTQPSSMWMQRWKKAIQRSLTTMQNELHSCYGQLNIASLSYACALGYLDFRHADMNWPHHYPELAQWYTEFAQRDSLRATAPPA